MKKMALYFIFIVVIAVITIICTVLASEDEYVLYLNRLGWQVGEKYIEKETVIIPDTFDEVYTEYNEIQKKAGFDLEKYKGRRAQRYTYTVTNYPAPTKSEVRANLIVLGGEVVGGDVMTVDLDGFMQPLNFLCDKD